MSLHDAIGTAVVAFVLIAFLALPFRPPRACSLCGIPLRGRDVVRHYIEHHSQETPMCDRTDWPCQNPAPHDAPKGCVHYAANGSDVPDRHELASGGEG